jgi:hypothetical protein
VRGRCAVRRLLCAARTHVVVAGSAIPGFYLPWRASRGATLPLKRSQAREQLPPSRVATLRFVRYRRKCVATRRGSAVAFSSSTAPVSQLSGASRGFVASRCESLAIGSRRSSRRGECARERLAEQGGCGKMGMRVAVQRAPHLPSPSPFASLSPESGERERVRVRGLRCCVIPAPLFLKDRVQAVLNGNPEQQTEELDARLLRAGCTPPVLKRGARA